MSGTERITRRLNLTYLRDLLYVLVGRDMKLRYRRSVIGVAWSLLNPLAQLLVLNFVFKRVLPLDIPNYRQRLDGFKQELARHRLKPAAVLVLDDPSQAAAEAEVARILRRLRRPLSVFAANYALTVGTLRAIRAAGRAVPDEVELVGFDDIQMADLLLYPVTTVDQDVASIGREAVRILLDAILNGRRSARQVLLPPRLIPR